MAGPLLESKINLPRLRAGLVERTRLLERLERAPITAELLAHDSRPTTVLAGTPAVPR